MTKGGTLAAATVLAGAGLFGPVPVAPTVAATAVPYLQQDVALAAAPAGSFLEAVQNLLNTWDLGTIDQVLALFGPVPGSSPEVDFNISSTVGQLLQSFNPGGQTLGEIFGQFGIPLGDSLYSSSGESLLGSTSFTFGTGTDAWSIDNPFVFTAPASFYTTDWAGDPNNLYSNINGTPLGNVDLGQLVDLLLGGAGEGDNHSLAELASQLGFNLNQSLPSLGGLTGIFSWLSGVTTYEDAVNKLGGLLSNFNVEENSCTLGICNNTFDPQTLTANSSLNDWLSGLLQVSTTDITKITHHSLLGGGGTTTAVLPDSGTTLGEYLQTLPWGTGSEHLGDQSLGDLLGMDPTVSWSTYLGTLAFGGIFFHPGTEPLGSLSMGDVITSWLPDGSGLTIDADTPITDILMAFLGQ
jgi:hypothetical protein